MQSTINYLIKNYNFNYLFHFTDFSNLNTILGSGFLNSRNHCINNHIDFNDSAEKEIIASTSSNITNSVRFYFKEKSMTLYRNEGIKADLEPPHLPIPVYLLFDLSLLFNNSIYFSDGNAKSKYTSFSNNNDAIFFRNNINWNAVFHEGSFNSDDYEFKRQMQAEALCTSPVSLDYLKIIIFRCEADFNRFKTLYPNSKYPIEINPNLFHNHRIYIYSYNFLTTNGFLYFDVAFSKKIYDSSSIFKIELIKDDNIIYKQNYYANNVPFNKLRFNIPIGNVHNLKILFKFYLFDILVIEEFLTLPMEVIS